MKFDLILIELPPPFIHSTLVLCRVRIERQERLQFDAENCKRHLSFFNQLTSLSPALIQISFQFLFLKKKKEMKEIEWREAGEN